MLLLQEDQLEFACKNRVSKGQQMIILEMMVSGRDRFDRKFKKWKFKTIKCPQVALKKYVPRKGANTEPFLAQLTLHCIV